MTITVTIAPAVESIGIQTIAVALGLTSVTDAEARAALGENLRKHVAALYLRGDQIKRVNSADAAALSAAAANITVT